MSLMFLWDSVQLDDSLTFVEVPIAIMGRDVRRLRSREISVVKVQWRHHPVKEVIWETERDMRAQYFYLFEPSVWQHSEAIRKGKASW